MGFTKRSKLAVAAVVAAGAAVAASGCTPVGPNARDGFNLRGSYGDVTAVTHISRTADYTYSCTAYFRGMYLGGCSVLRSDYNQHGFINHQVVRLPNGQRVDVW